MNDLNHPKNWKYSSPSSPGFHKIVNPENSILKLTHIFRLNISQNDSYELNDPKLELNALIVKGKIKIHHKKDETELSEKDSFYTPSKTRIQITALSDVIIYIGGGPCEGKGNFYSRRFDPDIPLGNIRQIHGKPPYRRDVFMTISQEDPASRLICGITRGAPGAWTSWPPHQHTKDLEEVYFYFNIPAPSFVMHLSSRKKGETEFIHTVSSGDCMIIPEGYHPTVGIPGVCSNYFWVMTAHSALSRRYDLAVNDPNFAT